MYLEIQYCHLEFCYTKILTMGEGEQGYIYFGPEDNRGFASDTKDRKCFSIVYFLQTIFHGSEEDLCGI
jgi:hypothetical protein